MSSATYQFPRVNDVAPPIVFGKSEAMQALRDCLGKVACASVPVLIEGESGTGKDIVARSIHGLSPWRSGPFVKVNCSALPGTLLEGELFGHEQDLVQFSRPGRVELAQRGTLFLDEVSELDLVLQSKILQLLVDGHFCRLGGERNQKVELRIVCATSRRLEAEIESGAFRRDLFYRLNVVNLQLPPLRERHADIPELASYFLEYYNRRYDCRARALSVDALDVMRQYPWPGNVRELENLIKRCVILGSEDVIRTEIAAREEQEFFHREINLDKPISLKKLIRDATHELEREVILKALQANRWNRRRAARTLGISYRGLLYKIRDSGICPSRSVTPPKDQGCAANVERHPTP